MSKVCALAITKMIWCNVNLTNGIEKTFKTEGKTKKKKCRKVAREKHNEGQPKLMNERDIDWYIILTCGIFPQWNVFWKIHYFSLPNFLVASFFLSNFWLTQNVVYQPFSLLCSPSVINNSRSLNKLLK